jgi:AraC-like DNA-binding protein
VQVLEAIRRLAVENPEGARDAALWLVGLLTSRAASELGAVRGGLAPWQKHKIDQYLREHLQRPVRVNELAQQLPLSVSYFSRAFKQTFGTSPHEYIIQLRLERAQELMVTTAAPLSQIALDCGFGDQAHLSKLFRRGMGESPSTWRRRNFKAAKAGARSRELEMRTLRDADCGQ